MLIDTVY